MMKILKFLIIIFAISQQANAANDKNYAIISEAKEYLRSINSIAAEFTQLDPNGGKFHGMLLIEKPYNFRCNYYAPYPLLIAGSKNFITMYDYEMDQISRIPAEENLLFAILGGNDDIEKNFAIISAFNKDNKLIVILKPNNDDRKVTINISNSPKKLLSLEIIDINNDTTTIKINKIFQVSKFNKDLFIIKNPSMFGPPARLNKEQLMSKFHY